MKISKANLKAKLLFLLYICTAYMAISQKKAMDSPFQEVAECTYKVELDTNIKVNANRKYINFFSLQDEEYIRGLYHTNQMNMKDHQELTNPAKLVKYSGGNNSLIFTVRKDGVTFLDTLRNSLHPDYEVEFGNNGFLGIRKWFAKMMSRKNISIETIEGRLPKGGMTWISAKRKRVEFGIFVPDVSADVTITLKDKNNEIISIIIDDILKKGWNNYEWERGALPKGKYKISYTMNGQSMSQLFKC